MNVVEWLKTLLLVVNVISAVAVVGFVLLQQGKGADMGASFGSGASGTLFGASGSSNFLSRSTAIFAAIFLSSCLAITYLSAHGTASTSVLDANPVNAPAAATEKPAAPVIPE